MTLLESLSKSGFPVDVHTDKSKYGLTLSNIHGSVPLADSGITFYDIDGKALMASSIQVSRSFIDDI